MVLLAVICVMPSPKYPPKRVSVTCWVGTGMPVFAARGKYSQPVNVNETAMAIATTLRKYAPRSPFSNLAGSWLQSSLPPRFLDVQEPEVTCAWHAPDAGSIGWKCIHTAQFEILTTSPELDSDSTVMVTP